ncbi:MAG: Fic family protein, partial [Bifidobacteriaceae bacterium]|nr:Fic family protein [Bifidobacteriaceae bacterium]
MTSSAPSSRRGRPPRQAAFDAFAGAIEELRQLGGLPTFSVEQPAWHALWLSEAHLSTAVEGNTLALREVEALLDQGRTVGAKELTEYLEVLGYAEASRWVFAQADAGRRYEHDRLVTLTELRELHRLALGPVWEVAPHPAADPSEAPGSFRRHEIRSFPGGMTPPTFPLVPPMLDDWLRKANEFGRRAVSDGFDAASAPVTLAELHAEFERIHPFIDGNGRAGRLVLNLMLARLRWPPVLVFKSGRHRYLSGLTAADRGNPEALAEILARSAVSSLHRLMPGLT